jgi:pyruvate/2-oxoglutarate dehydrogenase complex dihydrolipoamide acyltransferase (E2) component
MNEGSVARWLKAPGERVEKDEPIAEIETAKAVQELPAAVSGTLVEILVPVDEDVEVRTAIAVIET